MNEVQSPGAESSFSHGDDQFSTALKKEVVNVFQEGLQLLWQRLAALLGSTAAATIFRSAWRETLPQYPFLSAVEIRQEGISFDCLLGRLDDVEYTTLRAGFVQWLDRILVILVELTGDILLPKVQPLVERLREENGDR